MVCSLLLHVRVRYFDRFARCRPPTCSAPALASHQPHDGAERRAVRGGDDIRLHRSGTPGRGVAERRFWVAPPKSPTIELGRKAEPNLAPGAPALTEHT